MPMHYSSSSYRANNITTGTNNTYPIYLSNVPKGNGTYQQLITINNYSKYGINDNGSNIEFFDSSNYTHLYSWIQSINATSMQVWIKNYNASNIIYIKVLLSFENLFSINGYLGYGRKYFNAVKIFPFATDFINTTGITSNSYTSIESYGLNISQYGWVYSNNSFNTGYFGSSFTIVGNAGGNFAYFGVDNYKTNNGNQSLITTGNIKSGYMGYLTSDYYNFYIYNTIMTYSQIFNGYIHILSLSPSSILFDFNGIQYKAINDLPTYHQTYPIFDNLNQTSWINAYYMFYSPVVNMPTFTIGTSLYHSIDFKLIGSSTSINWGIFINGTFYNANSSNIYLNMTNGYYNIIVNLPAGYSPIASNVLKVNNTNQIFKIVVVSQNNNSNFSNDIMYAIILASIIIAVALFFSRRN